MEWFRKAQEWTKKAGQKQRFMVTAAVLCAVLMLGLGLTLHYRRQPKPLEVAMAADNAAAEAAATAPAPPEAAPPAEEPPRPTFTSYVVKEGDNLWTIARERGLSVDALTTANGLKENSVLKIGQQLQIMPVDGVAHKVVKGDTLAAIAKKYKVTEETILKANAIDPAALQPETWLVIPGGKAPAEPASPASTSKSKTVTRGSSGTGLSWPVQGRITSRYGSRIHPISGKKDFHEGIDIGAPAGTSILAAADGVVEYAGWMGGYGNTVIIRHGNGLKTQYSHNSANLASVGQTVKKGQRIARVGQTGSATGPHLHLNVIKNGEYMNPLSYLP